MAQRKKLSKKTAHQSSDIRPDLQEIIENVFPDGIVEWQLEAEEGELEERYDRIGTKLATLRGAGLFSDHPADSRTFACDDDDDSEAYDFPSDDVSYSYRRYFLGVADPRCQRVVEDQDEDEEGDLVEVERTDTLGCIVALCEFAPLAIVRFASIWHSDNGDSNIPDIGDRVFDLNGVPLDMEAHFSELFGNEALKLVCRLRQTIVDILTTHRVTVIPDEEAKKAVPWLKTGEDVIFTGAAWGWPITVQDAFFFMLP
jgi:hypothetical protein